MARILAVLAVAAGIALAIVYRGVIDPRAIQAAIAANPFAPLIFVALQVAVRDADAVLARARARSLGVMDQAIGIGGIRFEPLNA